MIGHRYLIAFLLIGAALLPAASATHSSVDCSSSGWGDESCSDTNSCNYNEHIGVHAYADDGQADEVHGEFACSSASASCTESDGNCDDISESDAGTSGVGDCSGYIKDASYDWNTFKLECFTCDCRDSASTGLPEVPGPRDSSNEPYSGWILEATASDKATGLHCQNGHCEPVPATCVDVGPRTQCWILT